VVLAKRWKLQIINIVPIMLISMLGALVILQFLVDFDWKGECWFSQVFGI
jgi:hypothetical protein